MKYINNKDTFILVVTPATEDVGNCEALTLARSVDPNGLRTLGVITKPDVQEEGWDGSTLVKILQNKISPLFKGYIAIKNRNKRQTDSGVTAQDNLKVQLQLHVQSSLDWPCQSLLLPQEEKDFFASKAFASVRDRTGSSCLMRTLCREFGQRIKEKLPQLSSDLTAK